MFSIDTHYINGRQVAASGNEWLTLDDPATGQPTTRLRLGTGDELNQAVAAAKAVLPMARYSQLEERATWLERLAAAVDRHLEEMIDVTVAEYGGPITGVRQRIGYASAAIRSNIDTLRRFAFIERRGQAEVQYLGLGVAGLITPWNSSIGFICSKLATALAAGCPVVVKPSELSARQNQLIAQVIDEAQLPAGLFNMVQGTGETVGKALVAHPDIAKISFTGSTGTGRYIQREGAATLKRVTLELGGKSPNILLPDADFEAALPLALAIAFNNSGQACLAGTRLLVPRERLAEAEHGLVKALAQYPVGNPSDPAVYIGPMVSAVQYRRVQGYIARGIDSGARLVAGGLGNPEGLEAGYFVRPTIFSNVSNDMVIARDEIFGPVLSVLPYDSVEEAVAIANDTDYGLHAYVSGGEPQAREVANRLLAGRVCINGLSHEPQAPFGGFGQSGIGREFGVEGLRAYMEPRVLL
ncbi:aldehyde dehydrogenase family protein [Gallaecimonas pentaromativorans]|uniref:aldehyde dehydrogenase family protein n=1 Tax=Gallaecimonas pentaromativorans TaxID=584787 RepID=UPI003A934231